jgi:DNA-binding MarR family transcriptional regulator
MSSSNKISKNFDKYEKQLKDQKIEFWRQLLLLVESNYKALEKKLNQKDCSYPKFRVLFIIYFDGPCNAVTIAKRIDVSRSNISTFLDRLEKNKLIKPCPTSSTAARPKYILTKTGIEQTEELFNFHFENIRKLPFFEDTTILKKLMKLTNNI